MIGSHLGLARLAAEAEMLRLRRLARRMVLRVIVAAAAALFLLSALLAAQAAVWLALQPAYTPLQALAWLIGGDIVLGLILALIAGRAGPGAIEREALRLRNEAGKRLVTDALLIRAITMLWRTLRRRR